MFIGSRATPGVGEGSAGAQQAVTQLPGSFRLPCKSHWKVYGESLLRQAPSVFYKAVLNSFLLTKMKTVSAYNC